MNKTINRGFICAAIILVAVSWITSNISASQQVPTPTVIFETENGATQ